MRFTRFERFAMFWLDLIAFVVVTALTMWALVSLLALAVPEIEAGGLTILRLAILFLLTVVSMVAGVFAGGFVSGMASQWAAYRSRNRWMRDFNSKVDEWAEDVRHRE